MIVMKFGGTSVGSREAIGRTIEIIRGRLSERPVVVVSAMSKVTDMLYAISSCVASGDLDGAREGIERLREKHLGTIAELMQSDPLWRTEAESRINAIIDRMAAYLDSPEGVAEIISNQAIINSKGEYLSSNMIYCAMNSCGIKTSWVDAREFMVTSDDVMNGVPDTEEIVRLCPKSIDAAFSAVETSSAEKKAIEAVITQGFVGTTRRGVETVLGRGGSDYSASLIGMALDAQKIEIWTDVDGVQSADPRKVDGTRRISRISFEEAAEMAAYGAKVLHPKTIEPAVAKNIPVLVLNSMNPGGEGTVILQSAFIEDGVKSVSAKEKILLVSVSEPVLSNASDLLSRTFAVLREEKVNVDLVNVGPSEILFTTDSRDYIDAAVKRLGEFAHVEVSDESSQVSVIGKNISELKVALRRASGLLGSSRLVSVAQNESYVNISFVVPRDKVVDATREIHSYLFGK